MAFRSASRFVRKLNPESLATGTRVAHYLMQLRRHQWRSPEELRQIQFRRLTTLIQYAYENVPYYRRLFDRVPFKPQDLKSLTDLRTIPVTTKQDVRSNPGDFLSKAIPASRHRCSFTSGSTGIPLRIIKDAPAHARSLALKAYAFLECGVSLADRFVTVAQSDGSVWPRHIIIPPSPHTERIVAHLREVKPHILYSYPTLLTRMATCDVAGILPKLIFTQGVTLTQQCRDVAQSLFGVDPLDTYGSVEFSRLAFECPAHSGLHTITDAAVVEFLNDGEPAQSGHAGDIVVTGLHNYAMPLIRYQLDDVGIPIDDLCECGRNWPLIKSIEGRTIDYLTMPSGQKLFPGFFYYAIHSEVTLHVRCIAQFQIVQEERDQLVLSVVKGMQFDPEVVARIREKLESSLLELGEEVTVRVQIVNAIATESSGKSKIVLSLVD